MNYYLVATVCSHTIGLAAIAGLVRFGHVLKAYRPFLFFLILAWINEILSTVLIYNRYSNAINSNIYVLVEFLLLLWQFRNWGTGKRKDRYYIAVAIVVGFVWIADNMAIYGLDGFEGFYRLVYSIVLVFLSVDQVNHLLLVEHSRSLRDARFIICIALLLFYSFNILPASFFVFHLEMSNAFYANFLLILVAINVITNLVFFLAVICLPTKQKFSVHYS